MDTYEIAREQIKGKPICEGYKAIYWDCSTKGNEDFRYGNEGENLIGKIFTTKEKLIPCHSGLHFCKDVVNVFKYYSPICYNRYFKIKAYGKVVDQEEEFKSVAQTIEFVEEYNFKDFLKLIKDTGANIYDVLGDIYSPHDILCNAKSSSNDFFSFGNYRSDGNKISCFNIVSGANCNSNDNCLSIANYHSDFNCITHANNFSVGNFASNGIDFCFGLKHCRGAYNSIFCLKKNGIANCIFNKQSTGERCNEVYNTLINFNWGPSWTNLRELQKEANGDCSKICYPKIKKMTVSKAWSSIPQEMLEYIKNLPEFDEEIFNEIIQDDDLIYNFLL